MSRERDGMGRGNKGQEAVRVAASMTVREFGKVAAKGLFQRVVMESNWTRFRVRGEMAGGVDAVLSLAKEGGARMFPNPGGALALLRRMGVERVDVVMREWDVEMATLSMRQRPDVTARRLRRSRMTLPEQMLEASKADPSLAVFVPPGTQDPGPVSREGEYRRLVDGKLEGLARKAREEDARVKAERAVAEKAERKEGRRLSDAFIREWDKRGSS